MLYSAPALVRTFPPVVPRSITGPDDPGEVRLLTALAVLFFCSGTCALMYQVLWLRMLGWAFGVTVYAASTVWATFMAGLAIGRLVAGRLGDRVRNPLH